jgi:hypothetical protein
MGNWAEPAYESSYSSFQTFCASWSANSGTFNGGIGPCPSAVTVPVEAQHERTTKRDYRGLLGQCPVGGCDQCQGDCDTDADCMAGLRCFQRTGNAAGAPGCSGPAEFDIDYCSLIVPACTDSPNWADHFGSPCQIYIDHGRCIDGAITTMQTREEMSGWATIAPYDACCACGRGVAPRVVPTTCVTCSGSTNVDGYWGTYTGLTKGFATYGPFTCMEGSDGLLTFRGHGSCP